MVRRKAAAAKDGEKTGPKNCHWHYFKNDEKLREKLLFWYDKNQRILPWRSIAVQETDPNVRGYAVWVSEVMLQQTQVATVIDYYTKWMKKWPKMEDLAEATLEEVNQTWSGLGYYSRGRRLWESAQKICKNHDGKMPQNAENLEKLLPGVGKYTAAAIASIAFNQPVGLVDGNVIRVISRMRKIGADVTNNEVIAALWLNANNCVDPQRPGDFNQALMELGATICTPKTPGCKKCPVRDHCLAFKDVKSSNVEKSETEIEDIEDSCKLCLPKNQRLNIELGVTNFPRKEKKTKINEKSSLVCILYHESSETFCLFQRPETGLLANLLEFPSIVIKDQDQGEPLNVQADIKEHFDTEVQNLHHCGEIMHQFSHIKQKYIIWSGLVDSQTRVTFSKDQYQKIEWLSEENIDKCAISTAMKKVFNHYNNNKDLVIFIHGNYPFLTLNFYNYFLFFQPSTPIAKKRKIQDQLKNQPIITGFFTKK
jgi:A/G-specific adenine glycosylase